MWTGKDKENPLNTSKWLNQLTDDFAANLLQLLIVRAGTPPSYALPFFFQSCQFIFQSLSRNKYKTDYTVC